MNLVSKALFLILLILASACGERTGNGKKTLSLNEEQFTRLVADQTFECNTIDGGPCPTGIGRLVVYDVKNTNDSTLCSGFLVSKNLFITNHHCVANEAQCRNTYISIYNGDAIDKVRCSSLIHTEVDNNVLKIKQIDFSILKLDRDVLVSPFNLANEKLVSGDVLKTWVVDHLSLEKLRITELNCVYEKEEYSIQLKNCPVIAGNSGGPVLNSHKEVVGVIWGSTVDEMINASYPLEARRELKDVGFATSVEYFRYLIDLQ